MNLETWGRRKSEDKFGSKFAIRTGSFIDNAGVRYGSNISGMRLEMQWFVTSGEWLMRSTSRVNGRRENGKLNRENGRHGPCESWRLNFGLVWIAGAGESEQKSDEMARKGKVRTPGLP
jgi:hypothetical protein